MASGPMKARALINGVPSDVSPIGYVAAAIPLTPVTVGDVALPLPVHLSGDPSLTGSQTYPLNERAADEVNVMSFIPRALRAGIRNRTNTTDLTQYIRAAVASGKDIRFPVGTYILSDQVTLNQCQVLRGAGVGATILQVPKTANLSAAGMIKGAAFGGIDGILINFDQSGVTTRAALTQYPWALDLTTATRFMIGHLRIQFAWNGINVDQSPSGDGFSARQLEYSCFNTGLNIDGIADYVQGVIVHSWPWGFAHGEVSNWTQLMSIYTDGTAVAMRVGRADAFNIRFFSSYSQRIILGDSTQSKSAFFGHVDMDGDGACMDIVGGTNIEFDSVNSTKSAGGGVTRPSIKVTHGRAIITRINSVGGISSADGDVSVQGDGVLIICGGIMKQRLAAYPCATVSGGGTLVIDSVFFDPDITQTRTAPYIQQTAGILIATNNKAKYRTTGSGVLISFGADGPGNRCSGNDFATWGYSVPFGSRGGLYGPNHVEPFTWTPAMSFGTPGDVSPTYTTQKGYYSYEATGIRFSFSVVGSIGTYTTASGAFILRGLPFAPVTSNIANPVAMSSYGALTLSSGYSQVGALAADSFVYFRQSGSAKGSVNLGTANVPSGTNSITLDGSGFIPQR